MKPFDIKQYDKIPKEDLLATLEQDWSHWKSESFKFDHYYDLACKVERVIEKDVVQTCQDQIADISEFLWKCRSKCSQRALKISEMIDELMGPEEEDDEDTGT